ncbi:MAG: 4-alpha-glucanotransferase, partial [Candidatus Omnitrophota bacterium]
MGNLYVSNEPIMLHPGKISHLVVSIEGRDFSQARLIHAVKELEFVKKYSVPVISITEAMLENQLVRKAREMYDKANLIKEGYLDVADVTLNQGKKEFALLKYSEFKSGDIVVVKEFGRNYLGYIAVKAEGKFVNFVETDSPERGYLSRAVLVEKQIVMPSKEQDSGVLYGYHPKKVSLDRLTKSDGRISLKTINREGFLQALAKYKKGDVAFKNRSGSPIFNVTPNKVNEQNMNIVCMYGKLNKFSGSRSLFASSSLKASPTLLLVNDNRNFEIIIGEVIEPLDYVCLSAYDGKEALRLLLNPGNKIDVILLNIEMPVMDGIEFIKELEKLHNAGIVIPPIIVHSTSSRIEEILEEAMRLLKITICPLIKGANRQVEAIKQAISQNRQSLSASSLENSSDLHTALNLGSIRKAFYFSYIEKAFFSSSSLSGESKIESVTLEPAPGSHIPIGINKRFPVRITVETRGEVSKDDLAMGIYTNMNNGAWYNILIDKDSVIENSYENGEKAFTVVVWMQALKVGPYELAAYAKLKGQELVSPAGKNITIMVNLVPGWFSPDDFIPMYLYLRDMAAAGYAENFSGIGEYMFEMQKNAGFNTFVFSPFFPTSLPSPFTPISVQAIHPRLINWEAVSDAGENPIAKFNYFMLSDDSKRKDAFKLFRGSKDIQNYAKFVYWRIFKYEGFGVSEWHYDVKEFEKYSIRKTQIREFILYEQFVALEQFYNLLKLANFRGMYILGDMPFYRAIESVDTRYNLRYFMKHGREVLCPGFNLGYEQILGCSAAWNECAIAGMIIEGETDPRLQQFKYWDEVFTKVFGEGSKDVKISGWRLDALHMYGRGSYKENSCRVHRDIALWEKIAEYFMERQLLPIVEQLGGDSHAYEHLHGLGYLQYAFILDLKTKILRDFVLDICGISYGHSFTVVDTHDSSRWASEYAGMFKYLTGMDYPDNLRIAGPAFLGVLSLGPRVATAFLSLGETAAPGSIKEELRGGNGELIGEAWGPKVTGPLNLSEQLKWFAQIRRDNPAIAYSQMGVIPNNDEEHIVTFLKVHADNRLIVAANLSAQEKEVSFLMPLAALQVRAASRVNFLELKTNHELNMEAPFFNATLQPGQIAVYRLESVECVTKKQIVVPGRVLDSQKGSYLEWDWQESKHKETMFHSGNKLLFKNKYPFMLYLKNKNTGNEQIIPAVIKGNTREYYVLIPPLEKGSYAVSFFWTQKVHNCGWEGDYGRQEYHFRVLPEAGSIGKSAKFENLSLTLDKDSLKGYPHNTVTLANGKSSILRLPVRPLSRYQHYGAIETVGFTSKYDGFQVNLLADAPDEARRIVFRGTTEDAVIVTDKGEYSFCLDFEQLHHFQRYPLPKWVFALKAGEEEVIIAKTAVLEQGTSRFVFVYEVFSATEGVDSVKIFVRPDLDMRLHHEVTKHWDGAVGWWNGKHSVLQGGNGFNIVPINEDWKQWYPGFNGIKMHSTRGSYTFAPEWHYSRNPIEEDRSQDAVSDSYSPGFFNAVIKNGESFSLVFMTRDIVTDDTEYGETEVRDMVNSFIELQRKRVAAIPYSEAQDDSFVQKMVLALWEFIAKRYEFSTVIAGYPWFSDWGRDTFICFDGVLESGMYDIAKKLLLAFGKFEDKGMLPNIIMGETAGNYDTVDAPLLYVLSVKSYIDATGDESILDECLGARNVAGVIESIIDGYIRGTRNGIHMDNYSKLIWSPSHFTWMDTNFPACTPREGFTVENNARWYMALRFVACVLDRKGELPKALGLDVIAQEAKDNFNRLFWTEQDGGYLADCIDAQWSQVACSGKIDLSIRPNQLIAVLAGDLLSREKKEAVVKIVERKLLVPCGLRTLSEDNLPGKYYQYQGHYWGDEDFRRKPAYHNGTSWPHLFGDWALAYVGAYGVSQKNIDYVLSYFAPLEEHLAYAGVGSVSEIMDGNFPHWPRGCDAQAWSVANNLAAYLKIKYKTHFKETVSSSSLQVFSGSKAQDLIHHLRAEFVYINAYLDPKRWENYLTQNNKPDEFLVILSQAHKAGLEAECLVREYMDLVTKQEKPQLVIEENAKVLVQGICKVFETLKNIIPMLKVIETDCQGAPIAEKIKRVADTIVTEGEALLPLTGRFFGRSMNFANLRAVVYAVIEDFMQRNEGAPVRISLNFKSGLLTPFFIFSYFENFALNLAEALNNAYKHNPGRELNITITFYIDDEGGLVMEITDSGKGVEPENLEKVFQYKVRFGSTVAGYGVGLFVMRKNLEEVGGYVYAEGGPQGVGFSLKMGFPVNALPNVIRRKEIIQRPLTIVCCGLEGSGARVNCRLLSSHLLLYYVNADFVEQAIFHKFLEEVISPKLDRGIGLENIFEEEECALYVSEFLRNSRIEFKQDGRVFVDKSDTTRRFSGKYDKAATGVLFRDDIKKTAWDNAYMFGRFSSCVMVREILNTYLKELRSEIIGEYGYHGVVIKVREAPCNLNDAMAFFFTAPDEFRAQRLGLKNEELAEIDGPMAEIYREQLVGVKPEFIIQTDKFIPRQAKNIILSRIVNWISVQLYDLSGRQEVKIIVKKMSGLRKMFVNRNLLSLLRKAALLKLFKSLENQKLCKMAQNELIKIVSHDDPRVRAEFMKLFWTGDFRQYYDDNFARQLLHTMFNYETDEEQRKEIHLGLNMLKFFEVEHNFNNFSRSAGAWLIRGAKKLNIKYDDEIIEDSEEIKEFKGVLRLIISLDKARQEIPGLLDDKKLDELFPKVKEMVSKGGELLGNKERIFALCESIGLFKALGLKEEELAALKNDYLREGLNKLGNAWRILRTHIEWIGMSPKSNYLKEISLGDRINFEIQVYMPFIEEEEAAGRLAIAKKIIAQIRYSQVDKEGQWLRPKVVNLKLVSIEGGDYKNNFVFTGSLKPLKTGLYHFIGQARYADFPLEHLSPGERETKEEGDNPKGNGKFLVRSKSRDKSSSSLCGERELNDIYGIATSLKNEGKYIKALSRYNVIINFLKKVGPLAENELKLLRNCYIVGATCLASANKYLGAVFYAEKALEFSRDDLMVQGQCYVTLANILYSWAQYELRETPKEVMEYLNYALADFMKLRKQV